MKKRLYYFASTSAAILFGLGSLQAAPFITLGDTVDVFFLGRASAEYRSNLFNAPQKNDDFVFTVSPGLEARIGRNSDASIVLTFREDFLFYNRYNSQNTNLAHVKLAGAYDNGPLALKGSASFDQRQTNTPDSFVAGVARDRFVSSNLYNVNLEATYDYSPLLWGRGGVSWSKTDYTNRQYFANAFADSNVYTVPLTAYYRYSEKLSVGLGYRYRHTRTDTTATRGARNYNDHFFNLSLDGELFPKLTTKAHIGYQLQDRSGKTDNLFALNVEFHYELTPKVNLFAGADHDFGVSSTGGAKTVLSGYIGANYQFNSFISATGRFDQVNTKYSESSAGREDDSTYLNFSVNYAPNNYWVFSAGYGYTNNSSNVSAASFSGHSINLSASLRY